MTLQDLGWHEIIHNEKDFIFQFRLGNTYIDIDKEDIDIYYYDHKTDSHLPATIKKQELDAICEIMKHFIEK